MNIKIPSGRQQSQFKLLINSGKGGSVTNIDEARQNANQSPETLNMTLEQDGLWTVRPGTEYYGTTPASETSILGASEFVVDEDTREIILVGGSGTVYKSVNDGNTWSTLSGATMTTGKKCRFLQIDDKLYITNSTDRLTYYDGSALQRNSQISNPTNLAGTLGGGLSSGSYHLYYRVIAINGVGFTAGSNEVDMAVNIQRDVWSTATEKIDFTWDAVTGATRYEIYLSDESGAQLYLDETTTNSYSDDGSAVLNPYKEIPDDNTTGGPILGRLSLSNGRIWGIDENNRVVFSGTGQNINYFSFFYGGGYTYLDKGGREFPVVATHYRTGKGDTAPTVFSKTPDGRGGIWQIAMDSLTIGDETIIIPSAVKIVGSIGSQGETAVTDANDNLFSANKNGVHATRNKAQIFNVLSTEEQSVNIRPSWRSSINSAKYKDIFAYYFEGKVHFCVSQNGTNNDTIAIYDLEKNAWIWNWDIGFEQLFEYTDTNNSTHLLAVEYGESKLIEINQDALTDKGVAISTLWKSPLIHIDPKDKSVFAKIKDVVVELGRPQGTIYVEVLGLQKNKPFQQLASRTITDTVSAVDFANDYFSDYAFGEDDEVPTVFSQASVKKRLRVNKLLNAIQYRIYSTQANTRYTILSILAKGRIVPTRMPNEWDS